MHITASVEPDVKKLYFQCLIHASEYDTRNPSILPVNNVMPGEWISGAVCMYVADGIVQRFNDGDKEVRERMYSTNVYYVTLCGSIFRPQSFLIV